MAKIGKRGDTLKAGKLIGRATVSVVLAAIIFSLVQWLLKQVPGEGVFGLVVSTLGAVLIIVIVVPQIFKLRKGTETIINLVLAIPLGIAVVTLVNGIFAVSVPLLVLPALGSLQFVIAMASYYLGDYTYLTVAKMF